MAENKLKETFFWISENPQNRFITALAAKKYKYEKEKQSPLNPHPICTNSWIRCFWIARPLLLSSSFLFLFLILFISLICI